jgi:hypothetical protein
MQGQLNGNSSGSQLAEDYNIINEKGVHPIDPDKPHTQEEAKATPKPKRTFNTVANWARVVIIVLGVALTVTTCIPAG